MTVIVAIVAAPVLFLLLALAWYGRATAPRCPLCPKDAREACTECPLSDYGRE